MLTGACLALFGHGSPLLAQSCGGVCCATVQFLQKPNFPLHFRPYWLYTQYWEPFQLFIRCFFSAPAIQQNAFCISFLAPYDFFSLL